MICCGHWIAWSHGRGAPTLAATESRATRGSSPRTHGATQNASSARWMPSGASPRAPTRAGGTSRRNQRLTSKHRACPRSCGATQGSQELWVRGRRRIPARPHARGCRPRVRAAVRANPSPISKHRSIPALLRGETMCRGLACKERWRRGRVELYSHPGCPWGLPLGDMPRGGYAVNVRRKLRTSDKRKLRTFSQARPVEKVVSSISACSGLAQGAVATEVQLRTRGEAGWLMRRRFALMRSQVQAMARPPNCSGAPSMGSGCSHAVSRVRER